MSNQFGRVSEMFLHTERNQESGETLLADSYVTEPFKITHPFSMEKGWKQIMILSTSAGMMAGDQQNYQMEIGTNSRVEITSQAYEKVCRMKHGYASRQVEITVEKGGILSYQPQPVIPFAGSDFRSRTRIHLKEQAVLIMSDILSTGRAAMGERFVYSNYRNLVELYKSQGENSQEILSYRDNTWYRPRNTGGDMDMSGFGMYERHDYLLNILISNMVLEEKIQQSLRDCLFQAKKKGITAGISRTWDGDTVIRALGMRAEELEKLSEKLLEYVHPANGFSNTL